MSEFRRKLLITKELPKAESYIQQDLIFQLDGLEKGNVSGAWTDLINGYSFTGNATELDNGYDFNGTQYLRCNGYNGISQLNSSHEWTFEIAFHSKSPSSWSCVFTTDWNYDSRKKHINVNTGIYNNVLNIKSGTSQLHDGANLYIHDINRNSDYTWSTFCNSRTTLLNLNPSNGYTAYGQGLNGHSGNMNIGARNQGEACIRMTIYAIRIYNRELTQTEMLYNQQLDIQRFNLKI